MSAQTDCIHGVIGKQRMLRKIYLTSALEQLMAQGRIHRPSRAHSVLRLVIRDGAAALTDQDRQFYDLELVPLIERAAA